jgi:hypothetical protein
LGVERDEEDRNEKREGCDETTKEDSGETVILEQSPTLMN